MLSLISKVFVKLMGGSRNDRLVRARMAVVRNRINPLEARFRSEYLDLARQAAPPGEDAEEYARRAAALELAPLAAKDWLSARTADYAARLAGGEAVSSVLPEAFAAIRMASWISQNLRQFDVQLVAGQILFEHTIAEEATGEGKTIACYPAIYLGVLSGKKVHVVTVNDYLVFRDASLAHTVFSLLGVSVGYIQAPMRPQERHGQYACNIIYGTNSEFGFDYLRDNIASSVADQVQKRQDYAVVDEVDSILIDEARTPLIISGPAFGETDRFRKADAIIRDIIKRHQPYQQADRRVESLKRQAKAMEGEVSKAESGEKGKAQDKLDQARMDLAAAQDAAAKCMKYYEIELDKKQAHLTHEGITAAQEIAGIGSFYVGNNMEWPHLLENSLKAHVVYERDKEYVVREDEVVIVDEFTGRLMEGRQWSDGLHQAVEAKERVTIKEENQTMATVTFQNFFKLYGKLAGMTGTAMTEAEEFMKIYKLDVVTVPTHRPVNRVDHDDRIYTTNDAKYNALVEEINDYSKRGRPVLVGTTSIEKSDFLSNLLTRRYGIVHQVLNARPENAAREADIVAQAGQRRPIKSGSKEMVGTVTIATNMAGRGTDIKLGPGVVWEHCKVPSLEVFEKLGVKPQDLYPPGVTKCCIHCPEYSPKTRCAHCFKPKLDKDFPNRGKKTCPNEVPCGLHIVGTERHEARRIDNQLRGRSGRQGDPGSSRFFLSFQDDLMVMFAGETMLKFLGRLGMQETDAFQTRGLSKGVERAQKKVEQRNFDIRKNLLEYDEVMDHQRRFFYQRRQAILEGREIEQVVRQFNQEVIADAVDNYLAGNYPSRCISEWARVNLEVAIPAEQIHAVEPDDLADLERHLKEAAQDEAAGAITLTLGEYIDVEADSNEWDLKGLASWAMSRFSINISQAQLRKMTPEEIEETLIEQARAYVEGIDCSPVGKYLEKMYRSQSLADWAFNKFGLAIPPEELPYDDMEAAKARLIQAIDHAYLRREIEYPPQFAIEMTIGQTGADNVYARQALCEWGKAKYGLDWTAENTVDRTAEQMAADLTAAAEAFLAKGELEKTVDTFLASLRESADADAAIADFARVRFDTVADLAEWKNQDIREKLIAVGRAFLRRELTELERFVLLQIHDSSWIDHLLAMDHLRHSVSMRAFAEQDPRIAYKKEGFRQFQEMLAGVREKVTNMIFKVRLSGGQQVQSAYRINNVVHEQLSGYDHLSQTMAAQRAAAAPTKIETIVRDEPRVGRNDPCPCGSGKKYKKCCGRMMDE